MYKNNPSYEIFTPINMVQIMVKFYNGAKKILDPAVGTGNLIKIFSDEVEITGFDINQKFLEKIEKKNVILHNEDFLKSKLNTEFDFIIMNPPYIKIQNLEESYLNFIKNEFGLTGNFDIYYAFILKSLKYLSNEGIFVSIIPNSWIFNKSGEILRNHLSKYKLIFEIIDFKDQFVFENISTYVCILVIKKNSPNFLYNGEIKDYNFFNTINDNFVIINKITGGIATLADKIFIHNYQKFDEPCWKKMIDGKYIIFPYENGEIIPENTFKNLNPDTYNFLEKNKDILIKRDSGKIKIWYAFGRKQGLNIINFCEAIYISSLVNPEKFNYKILDKGQLIFKGGLVILSDNISEVIEHLEKNIKQICEKCPVKNNNYYNISTTILKKYFIQK